MTTLQQVNKQLRTQLPLGGLLLAALVVLAAVVAANWHAPQPAAAPAYPVDVRVQAALHEKQADIEAIVLARLNSMAQTQAAAAASPEITSMTVVTGADVATVVPNAGAPGPGSPDATAIVWVVRAQGTFVPDRLPPGAQPFVETTGYFVVDDATGKVLGMGMP